MANVLAIDPSLNETGYAVIIDGGIQETACIKTRTGDHDSKIRDRIRRLKKIYNTLSSVVVDFGIDVSVCEQVGGSRSASGVWSLAGSTAVVSSLVVEYDLDDYWYNKFTINNLLFDKRSVDKDEMVTRMESEFPGDHWPEYKYSTEAVSDALSVYYTWRNKGE